MVLVILQLGPSLAKAALAQGLRNQGSVVPRSRDPLNKDLHVGAGLSRDCHRFHQIYRGINPLLRAGVRGHSLKTRNH